MTKPVVVAADHATSTALTWAAEHAKVLGAPLELCPAEPADLLVAAARAETVVIGHHGPFALPRHLMAVVENATCDVVVVRGGPSGGHHRVTALITGSVHDPAVLARATELARQRGSVLRVLHAVPPLPVRADDPHQPITNADKVLRGIRHASVVARMHPHEAVTRYADTDLFVVGDPGPTTRAALHHAPCPVFVVHRAPVETLHLPTQRDRSLTASH
ncbi:MULTISPECIES: universal stress protein [unclassified Saccharothrix]|uniref:universal stress protein n=1 Tax=unclassified Saccharothrix TaxID=2593673 RepID=UPI00307FB273